MNTTACRTAAMLLPLYAGERLCEEAQALVGAHLQVCDHCRAALTRYCRLLAYRRSQLMPNFKTEGSV